MRTFKEKLELFEHELLLKKKRISDETIVELQEITNKIKELIDNEINRRAENLNKENVKVNTI